MHESPKLIGIMPTCGRTQILAKTLRTISEQTRPPDLVVLVDNEASPATRKMVEDFLADDPAFDIRYMPAPENLGSAGGWALAIEVALPEANDEDWLVTLDDDDPPIFKTELDAVFQFALDRREKIPETAAVGIVGARFNWSTGFLRRLPDESLSGAVEVDYVGNNHLAMYSVAVVRKHGGFRGELFFGHTEVEYCLRLRSLGYRLFTNGDLWRKRREHSGRLSVSVAPSRKCSDRWKKYYVIRNYIFIMLQFRRFDLALKQALIQIIIKPLYTLPKDPGLAMRGFRLAIRAANDGFRRRMGRTLTPGNFDAKAKAK